MGKFSGSELQAIIDVNDRLTGQIMRELIEVMKNHRGAFIFAATRKHCEECAKSLPDGEWAIITGETKHEDRKRFIESAKMGKLKYLISVNCLNVGVDIPLFDCCAWLRPTESLVLYTQGIGRVLRLHPGKQSALVLDYAGNLARHGDIDDPMINEALQPTEENEKDYIIPCCACGVANTLYARRCIGIGDAGRCTNYFEWKDCPDCGVQNDKTSRLCRACGHELIDPNAKLSLKPAVEPKVEFDVLSAKYWINDGNTGPQFNSMYETRQGLRIYENFTIKDDRMRNIFYGIFVSKQVKNASSYYPVLQSLPHLRKMLNSGDVKTPYELECKFTNNRYQIVKRRFHNEE
jgi:DNA repair protein RadD